MLLIHYGASEYRPELFKSISDNPFFIKPRGGLWCSPVDSEWGWSDWCKAEEFARGSLKKHFYVEFNGTLLVIDSVADLDQFPWIEDQGMHFITFQAMCCDGFAFDAIHLTIRGEQETRLTRPWSLYGWDCECVLVMNPASITPLDD